MQLGRRSLSALSNSNSGASLLVVLSSTQSKGKSRVGDVSARNHPHTSFAMRFAQSFARARSWQKALSHKGEGFDEAARFFPLPRGSGLTCQVQAG